jgi:hypothetical protein
MRAKEVFFSKVLRGNITSGYFTGNVIWYLNIPHRGRKMVPLRL